MADYDYDLFVIGAGSGGVRAARLTALDGKKVAVAEEYRVGGTCVIRGCVPKKFMVMASEVSHALEIAEGYGWSFDNAKFDWPTFLQAKDVEIARLSGIYAANLGKAGVDLVHGRAVMKDAHTVEVLAKEGGKNQTFTAEKILIATGGISIVITLFALISARAFVAPLMRLQLGVERLKAGAKPDELDGLSAAVHVGVTRRYLDSRAIGSRARWVIAQRAECVLAVDCGGDVGQYAGFGD